MMFCLIHFAVVGKTFLWCLLFSRQKLSFCKVQLSIVNSNFPCASNNHTNSLPLKWEMQLVHGCASFNSLQNQHVVFKKTPWPTNWNSFHRPFRDRSWPLPWANYTCSSLGSVNWKQSWQKTAQGNWVWLHPVWVSFYFDTIIYIWLKLIFHKKVSVIKRNNWWKSSGNQTLAFQLPLTSCEKNKIEGNFHKTRNAKNTLNMGTKCHE